jgi:hypothetical protein
LRGISPLFEEKKNTQLERSARDRFFISMYMFLALTETTLTFAYLQGCKNIKGKVFRKI